MNKTALEWERHGRVVKARSKPRRYLLSSDGGTRIALFSEAQTLPRSDFTEVAAGSLPAPVKRAVYYYYDGSRFEMYVGNRANLLADVKAGKWRFYPRTNRWWKQSIDRAAADAILAKIKERGYTPVERKVGP